MTEFRRDPLTHRWIVTGFAQSESPENLVSTFQKKTNEKDCPFCEGKEILTPAETYAIRKSGTHPNEPGWEVRVVPNRSTDLRTGELQKRGQGSIYDLQNASGVHETVIETPKHISKFSELPLSQMINIFKTLQLRNGEHKKNHLLKGILIFRNQGKGSAGIFEHSHSQIISLPFISKAIRDELEGAKRYYDLKTRCIFCDMIFEEKKINQRDIFENNHYFAWCPFASRFPFETWIVAKQHQSEFLHADSNTFQDLSSAVKNVLNRVEKVLGDVPISFVLHTAPLRCNITEDSSYISTSYHWHIEILPHVSPPGGFEWGGDFFLSPPTPETCAKILLKVDLQPTIK